MPRVLLINPPSPERLGAPLLGLQYVAAPLVTAGCEVRVIDAAARYHRSSFDEILAEVDAFRPDIVGLALFTRWVWHAYRLVEQLRGRVPLLVAGGAHATARPLEVLRHGFDVAVVGEAEFAFRAIALRAEELSRIPGVWFRTADGGVAAGPPAHPIDDLDQLPFPQTVQHLFDPRGYDPDGTEVIPGGMMTSRGCPARCTFCANYVTGRTFRYRSAANVVEELRRYHSRFGSCFFPFWDDALTANFKRVFALCEAFERDIDFPFQWSAITRANMVTREMLAAMKGAGCVAVNFGIESGDDSILRAIKKGVATRHVVRALEWAKSLDLVTACNFILGFPEDTPETLGNTLRFMERIAPLVDTFSTLGVAVPFPATPLYEDHQLEYGFTDWWLRQEYACYDAPPPFDDFDRFYRHYIDDANLQLDFFRYSAEVRDLIRAGLKFKGEHNLRHMGLLKDPLYQPLPAA